MPPGQNLASSVTSSRTVVRTAPLTIAELEQRHRAALAAGRAKRAAARPARRPGPSPAPADDSTATPRRAAAWYSGNSVSAAGQSDGCGALVNLADARLRLRDGIQGFSCLDSVRGCETSPIGETVGIRAREGEKTGFAGLMRCSSVWACPVCAARIRGERAATLERYALAWLKEGRGLYLVTLTVPHWARVRLADYTDDKGRPVLGQLSKLLEGWRGIGQGSWWVGRAVVRNGAPAPWSPSWATDGTVEPRQLEDGRVIVWKKGFAARHQVAGTTRTAEITDGANGWHSHLHALIWTEGPATREHAEQLQTELSRRWAARCKSVQLPTPDPKVGCRVDPASRDKDGQAALARYIAKVQERDASGAETSRALASELVRGDYKLARGAKGLTPYDIAHLATKGNETARERWHEYERATKGRRCLTWSHGLQERLAALCGEDVDERDDQALNEELAAAEARQPNLAIARRPFREAVAHRRGGRADVAMAGFVGGLVGVEQLLAEWGLQQGVDFWRLDPLGPGLPTSAGQITRGREAREARDGRVEAAGAAVAAWTPVKRAGIERRRQEAEDTRTWHRDNRARAVEKGKAAPVEQLEVAEVSRAAAHADFRARLRAAKAARA